MGRVSVSLLDRHEKEFGCLHVLSPELLLAHTEHGLEYTLKIDALQIDNQKSTCAFPIPFHTPAGAGFLALSGWMVNVCTWKYLTVVTAPFAAEIDEDYLKTVLTHFVQTEEPLENPKYFIRCELCRRLRCSCTFPKRNEASESGVDPEQTGVGKAGIDTLTIGYLKIEPVKMKLSFRKAHERSMVPISSLYCNVTSSKVSLPAIELADVHADASEVLGLLVRTYKRGMLRNIVSLALSADIVGSPGELIDKLGVGMHDLLYAPYRAMDNPGVIPQKLFHGGKSLAKNVVTGVIDFVGNISGALSKKLAEISMDEQFLEQAQDTSCRYAEEVELELPIKRTQLSKAGEKFMGSVISGFKGVLSSPIQGRKSNGLSGMVQGLGKGLVGAVFKPISGVMGLAQGVTNTISGALQDEKKRLRIQAPRAPPLTNPPREYERERSLYFRAYNCLCPSVSISPKNRNTALQEKYITGAPCVGKHLGWHVVITTHRLILYNRHELYEVLEKINSRPRENDLTEIEVNGSVITVSGARVAEEIELAANI